MNPFLAAYLVTAAIAAVLLGWGLLARLGAVEEPGIVHRTAVAGVSGILFAMSTTIFLPVVVFLSLLLGALALLALHYRGEGRWRELGTLLIAFGGGWVVIWGLIVVPAFLAGTAVEGGWLAAVIFGAGVAILSLGVATLVLRPGLPRP